MKSFFIFLIGALISISSVAAAWSGNAHAAIAAVAGMDSTVISTVAFADDAKYILRLAGHRSTAIEDGNRHFYDVHNGEVITAALVESQSIVATCRLAAAIGPRFAARDGNLYGALVTAARQHNTLYLAHYCGDLSMPLHNAAYTAFNKKNHNATDSIVERYGVKGIARRIAAVKTATIVINSDAELYAAIAAVANDAHAISVDMESNNRRLTEAEAIAQMAKSAALLKAIVAYIG